MTAQLLVRMVVSHYGWLESPVSQVTWIKLLGGALLIIGALLAVHEPKPPEPTAVEITAGIELPH